MAKFRATLAHKHVFFLFGLGIVFLSTFVLLGAQGAQTWLLKRDAFAGGMEWALHVEKNLPGLSSLLSDSGDDAHGVAHKKSRMDTFFNQIFVLGSVYHIDLIGRNGRQVHQVGNYDAEHAENARHYYDSHKHMSMQDYAAGYLGKNRVAKAKTHKTTSPCLKTG